MLQLNELEEKEIIRLISTYFLNIYKIIYSIDKSSSEHFKNRNQYYYNSKLKNHDNQSNQCCQLKNGKIYVPYDQQNALEKDIYELTNKRKLKQHLPDILEKLSTMYNNIKENGIKEGKEWNVEVQQYILNEVMKDGINQFFIPKILSLRSKDQAIESKQPLLFAYPGSWKEKFPTFDLNLLKGDSILNIQDQDYCQQQNIIGNKDFIRKLYKELDLLEMCNKFQDVTQQQSKIRSDKILWANLNEIQAQEFPNLKYITQLLSSLPYEINAKTQFCSQISEILQISYFSSSNTYHKKHMDSSEDPSLDNGRKFSLIYFVNLDFDQSKNEQIIQLFRNANTNNEEMVQIKCLADSLLIFKSRKIAFSIENNCSKRFLIQFWINGPAQPNFDYILL